ncbi:Spore protein SP21 [Maioricimonas rarisocia]|uniref:Spore protein SP21 n=1 Tax=Maioricimonas rarisocia TaxID=2528026 RepID=A0A517Z8L2_9PLAN|nr:Hsp20/alpha crystallin family protein [Maioricimonas rarisocia]QDU38805.1 Spore protein SP21 [Maioricimonas rarisocia]
MFHNNRLSKFWNVFEELEAEFDRQLAGLSHAGRHALPRGVNVWLGDDGAAIDVDLPGRDPGTVELTVEGDVVHLSVAEAANEEGSEKTNWRQRERSTSGWKRSFRLPFSADSAATSAVYEDGVLRIAVPRLAETAPARIEVKAR